MKQIILLFISLFSVQLLSSCIKDAALPGDIGVIKINNNSSENIELDYSNSYPDTSLKTNNLGDCDCGKIKPKSTCECNSRYGWKDHIKTMCKGGKLMLFIFNKDTINKYSWDTVVSKYKVSKRFELSIEDLENSNWTITYP